jgi:hypothetical protein
MDGATGLYNLGFLLQEGSSSNFLDIKASYTCLYNAAKEFVRRTNGMTAQQTIYTTANSTTYDLNPDFMFAYFMNFNNDLIIRYRSLTTGQTSEVVWRDYDRFVQGQQSQSVPIPQSFTITDKNPPLANITGLASTTGALLFEESALTEASALFANVAPGDVVYNTDDGSSGYVTEKVSDYSVKTTLFNGTNNYWEAGNAFVIVPQNRKVLVVDPPNLIAGDSIIIDYVQTPPPVFSSYRSYRIDSAYDQALYNYAAWIYKYRDSQPNMGDAFYKVADLVMRKATHTINRGQRKQGFRVNLNRRSFRDRSYR